MNTKIFISMPEKFEVVPFYREEEAKGTGIDKPGRKLRRNSRSFRIEPSPKWTGKWKNLCGKNDS